MKQVNLVANPLYDDIVKIYGSSHADYINLLVTHSISQGITESNPLSYVLATAKHETANYTSLYEKYNGDPLVYFKQYDGLYGNRPGTDDGYTYRGRGFVHLTFRDNYEKMGKVFGVDLVNNPDLAAEPVLAAKIAAYGMKNGFFTGRSLEDYFDETKAEFF